MLTAYAAWRTIRPIRYRDDLLSLARVLLEAGLAVWAVGGTGFWGSPYVFTLVSAVVVAGFARGFAFALEISVVSFLAVSIPEVATALDAREAVTRSAQWGIELVLVAVVAGYARRIFGEQELRHSLALDRLGRLAEANELLVELNHLAQELPASLDLGEVLDSTVDRLRELFGAPVLAMLVRDDTRAAWTAVRQEGVRLPVALADDELPAPMRRMLSRASGARAVADLGTGGEQGLARRSRSGLYASLRARGTLVGLLALEHPDGDHFDRGAEELLDGFVDAAALAIDNARWFSRLRTVGAEEERTRIARDLHDRIGQSLAYLAFELDRIIRSAEGPAREQLDGLRADLRGVVTEVRETLYDLRTDVNEERGLVEVLDEFLGRVGERSGLEVAFRHEAAGRLPVNQERELWRIAQEAVVNAERHADATHLTVTWYSDGHAGDLRVVDDGKGFSPARGGRMDSYGILGMRERAASIGARFEIAAAQPCGTRVRCWLGDPAG